MQKDKVAVCWCTDRREHTGFASISREIRNATTSAHAINRFIKSLVCAARLVPRRPPLMPAQLVCQAFNTLSATDPSNTGGVDRMASGKPIQYAEDCRSIANRMPLADVESGVSRHLIGSILSNFDFRNLKWTSPRQPEDALIIFGYKLFVIHMKLIVQFDISGASIHSLELT